MATETLYPDALLAQVGLTGDITTINSAEDGTWMTSTASGATLTVSFPTPTNPPTTGADLQTFRVFVRKNATGGGDPVIDELNLYENGTLVTTLLSGAIVTSAVGQAVTVTWDASALGTSDGSAVELDIVSTKGGGGPNERNVEFDSVSWIADTTVAGTDLTGQVEAGTQGTVGVGAVTLNGQTEAGTMGALALPSDADYRDDFSTYTVGGGLPAGWTERWDGTNSAWDIATNLSAEGDKELFQTATVNGRRLVSWDAVGATLADVEVLTMLRSDFHTVGGSDQNIQNRVYVRAAGTATNEAALFVMLQTTDVLEIQTYAAGASTTQATPAFVWAANDRIMIRFRVVGDNVKLRAWIPADPLDPLADEPGTWLADITQTDVQTAGWVGVGTFSFEGTKSWEWIEANDLTVGGAVDLTGQTEAGTQGSLAVGRVTLVGETGAGTQGILPVGAVEVVGLVEAGTMGVLALSVILDGQTQAGTQGILVVGAVELSAQVEAGTQAVLGVGSVALVGQTETGTQGTLTAPSILPDLDGQTEAGTQGVLSVAAVTATALSATGTQGVLTVGSVALGAQVEAGTQGTLEVTVVLAGQTEAGVQGTLDVGAVALTSQIASGTQGALTTPSLLPNLAGQVGVGTQGILPVGTVALAGLTETGTMGTATIPDATPNLIGQTEAGTQAILTVGAVDLDGTSTAGTLANLAAFATPDAQVGTAKQGTLDVTADLTELIASGVMGAMLAGAITITGQTEAGTMGILAPSDTHVIAPSERQVVTASEARLGSTPSESRTVTSPEEPRRA